MPSSTARSSSRNLSSAPAKRKAHLALNLALAASSSSSTARFGNFAAPRAPLSSAAASALSRS
jgi:hypothetical protein